MAALPGHSMNSSLLNNKDVWGGLMLIAIGAAAVLIARDYPFGTALRMGPGYFPTVLGAVLCAFGLYLAARGVRSTDTISVTGGTNTLNFSPTSFGVLTGAIGLAALLSYLLLYTPLKRRSDLCTLVGAFPGAAPILMGWTAVRDEITLGGWILYFILFFWQFPHFLAIGWMYRDDYARARMFMLPRDDHDGVIAFRQVWIMSAALIAMSLFPAALGMTGSVYLLAALLLGIGHVIAVHRAASLRTNASARELLHATVIYLPALFVVMVLDKVAPLYV